MANDNKLDGSRRKSLKTMMAALLAGSLAATAGGIAYAKTDGQAFDPAKFQQRIEKRVDKALDRHRRHGRPEEEGRPRSCRPPSRT